MRISDWSSDVCSSDLTCAANQEVFRGPFAGVVLAPGFAQPFAIRFEAARRHDTGTRGNALPPQPGGLKLTIVDFQMVDRGVITDLYAQGFGAAIVRVDQCFSTPHEKGVGAREMQCAGQRRLKMHTDRKSTRLNSSHKCAYRMPSSA